jgi:hypothetical protein
MRTAKQKSFGPQRFTDRLVGSFPVLEALEARQLLSVTISAPVLFTTLDNGPLDANPAVGAVQIADDLLMTGTGSITANDPASPANNSASPIILDVTGGMTMGTGTSIFAENRISGGSGGAIGLTVGKNLLMQSGSIISSSRTVGGGSGNGGNLTIAVIGDITLQPGSIVAANCAGSGKAGNILITSSLGSINIDGLVASGPSTTLLASKLTGFILAGGNTTQKGGDITIKILKDTGNTDATLSRLNVSTDGVIVSQGWDPSSGKITLESQCSGIRIDGLVGSVAAKQHGSTTNVPQVILRSPRFIEVNGADLAGVDGDGDGLLTHQGRVRADYLVGEGSLPANPNKVDMFARSYIKVTGPTSGDIFAVSAFGGTANNNALFGGNITAISLGTPTVGGIVAKGNAFDASAPGSKGGKIVLTAKNNVVLDDATIKASGKTVGGQIGVRSYDGTLSWQNGVGDVRPTGTGVTAANRGKVTLTATAAPVLTSTVFPVSSGAQTNPTIVIAPFDAAAQLELAALDLQLGLPNCKNITGECDPLDTTLVLDVDTTVNFNTALFDLAGNLIPGTVTYIGDLDLLPFFFPIASKSTPVDQWEARFNIGLHRLDILDGVLLTVTSVGIGNNQPAPGIEIKGGEIFLQEDLDKNGDGGGSIIVTSINQPAGHIFIDMVQDILVDGSIIDQVVGTNGTPGDIILKTFCGDIRVGKKGRVETRGVDLGGADIIMVDGVPGSLLAGDIVIEGLVRATYKGGTPATISIVNFKQSGQIIIDGRNDFGLVSEAGGNVRLMSGVHVKCLRDPTPGTINLQAVNDITVIGNNGSLAGSYGTVSAKSSSSNMAGGTINVLSLEGGITAQDRAFDTAGRYNDKAAITLKANDAIFLTAPSGTAAKPLAVVDNRGTLSGSRGGTNRIRSYSSGVTVGPNAQVLATGVATAGKNHLVGTPVTILGTVNPPNSVAPAADPINDPLAPLFPTLASLGL